MQKKGKSFLRFCLFSQSAEICVICGPIPIFAEGLFIQISDADGQTSVGLLYEDWHQDAPVVLSRGWPLDHRI